MYSYRGGSGPSRSTPANVQCQKCLKRGHYSYECKAKPQERPYIPRPSRTQQLFNPKLQPKLTNEKPDFLQEKKGVADQILAKTEADRAKKRELDHEEEDEPARGTSPRRRGRSPSVDSVSTISTRSGSPPLRRSPDPPRRGHRREPRDHSRRGHQDRGRSADSRDRYSRGPSESPERGYASRDSSLERRSISPRRSPLPPRHLSSKRSMSPRRSPSPQRRIPSRRSVSPPRSVSPRRPTSSRRSPSPRHRTAHVRQDDDDDVGRVRERPGPSHARRTYSRSRSPARSPPARGDGRGNHRAGQYRERDDYQTRGGGKNSTAAPPNPRQPPPPRERSLSPFSKRLALTKAMNSGR